MPRHEKRQQDKAILVIGLVEVAVHHEIGELWETAMPKVHQQEGKVVQNIDAGDLVIEFDAIEEARLAIEKADVAQVQIAMLAIVILVFFANLMLHRPLIESMLFSLALAVGLTPELLPAIISVTLARGARAMAANGVIVRRLDAIENLGSMPTRTTRTGVFGYAGLGCGTGM